MMDKIDKAMAIGMMFFAAVVGTMAGYGLARDIYSGSNEFNAYVGATIGYVMAKDGHTDTEVYERIERIFGPLSEDSKRAIMEMDAGEKSVTQIPRPKAKETESA